jgi:hypothetical protein
MTKRIDLTGQTFGKLVVVSYAYSDASCTYWLCQCECGRQTRKHSQNLRTGKTQSCGCGTNEKHGHTARGGWSPEYNSWVAMKSRCFNVNHEHYKDYGGRGITVCDRWKDSFENFYSDMGKRPDGMTLDRYPNNDGNYEPGNCRWATKVQQRVNQRKPVLLDSQM